MSNESLKDKTAKGLLWGGFSNGMQQLLNLVFGIFLARMLSPEDYGMVGMLAIFSLIAASLQESGFTTALANRKAVSKQDYTSVFWFSTGMSVCIYLLLFALAPLIAAFYGVPELTPLARYSFLGFVISSLGIAHNAYFFKNLMVKQKSIALVLALFVSGCVGVGMAYYGFAYWGIATQSLVYVSVVTLTYWYFSPWRPTFTFTFQPIREMFAFSSKMLLTNLFTHLNNNIFTVLIGRYASPDEVGHFTQANKWHYMGHSFIGGMITGVAQPILVSTADDPERQLRVFRKMLRFASFLSFPVMLGFSLIAPQFITLAITEKWLPSATILQILCIHGAFIPILQLYSNLIVSKGKSHIYMWSTIALGVLQLGVITLLFYLEFALLTTIALSVAIQVAWLGVWHYFVQKELSLSIVDALKDILPFGVMAAAVMLATHWLTSSIEWVWLLFITRILLAASLYILLMWGSGSVTFKESVDYLLKKKRGQ
ncbi:MAG: lipopolysaccharide biosynthesis protein [Phocaeicola sp.]